MTDSDQLPLHLELALPVLLRESHKTYGRAIRAAYEECGFIDVPRLGPRILGGLHRYGCAEMTELPRYLGVSKQATSQAVDTLAMRGYVERLPHDEDRRKMIVQLTPRGTAAADEQRAAIEEVDALLTERFGADKVVELREMLLFLMEQGAEHGESDE